MQTDWHTQHTLCVSTQTHLARATAAVAVAEAALELATVLELAGPGLLLTQTSERLVEVAVKLAQHAQVVVDRGEAGLGESGELIRELGLLQTMTHE